MLQTWYADSFNMEGRDTSTNYRLNAQLRRTILDIQQAIDTSIASTIARRTTEDMQLWHWTGGSQSQNLPVQCGNTVANKALRWCLTDTYPGGANNPLVIPIQGVDDVTDTAHRFLQYRRIGMLYYAQVCSVC